MTEKDVGKYALGASGVVATIVFANLLVQKINGNKHPKALNISLIISGTLLLAIGVAGSMYINHVEKKLNGNTNT